MAADDDDRGQAPDPWDEIVADGLGEGLGEGNEISFNFDEVAEGTPAEAMPPEDVPGEPVADGAAEPTAAAEDALVEHWLTGGDGEADTVAEPAAPAFPTEDQAAGSSAIEIGTGVSGVAIHGQPEQEEIGAALPGGDSSIDPAVSGWPAIDTGDAAGGGTDGADAIDAGFPVVTAAVTATTAAAAGRGPKRPARPGKTVKKGGGIGQMIGVVLGGATAIPITMAILIYGLGKDPFGITKSVPAEVAFLLPEKFRPGFKKPTAKKPGADAAGPSALDDLPTVPVAVGQAGEPTVDPALPEPPDVSSEITPDVPPAPAPRPDADVSALDDPGLDPLDTPLTPAIPPAPPAPAEPPPLDTAALDDAVGEAAALSEAINAVDDRGSKAYNKLRIRWYRALARVAQELVGLEHAAASSGRPLAGPPENVAALQGTLGGHQTLVAELAALAPEWLTYANRGSDGVVLPVTFESARKVGPYWAARVSLAVPGGDARTITVISRSEPAAVSGDVVVVTGVALDGVVIWAADVRGSGGAAAPGL